ncbi:uncharacterized protein LOC123714033 isoform X5 [Pieris brassicae]|uniref:uncharacterized protein LOC123714033 isoform X5 n=1 Tax=Pieris brassicae TaxID=7116 RepID=UPI001E65EEB1|nr:uncharacterized protein LOC123714033 isoform X5 [Pieris brassicae]
MGSMRYFSAGALFTLVLLTECLGANDRSRQRSGPIRSVPVAADIKREADFDCPEEFGYYPHPTDCTLYYVCVFGGALLESCTGGLMYSHELQTCDWPRNVGCDATGAVVAEDLERLNEREPPPPPPRRNPPPAPRLQPKPVVTSRGQPQYSRREEYEKQQQLYAEVDDLPPVEELETDRQQRVYRGQPSTIGQVQKDRDGYVSQPISSGRTLNANIIPASLNQNSKIGSFSFGSQVDERRTATATQAPQTYSLEPTESIPPSSFSASPRPKMLYNGSQAYSPDQYDPYYAVYDEDGELYKDTDYVQQYNVGSLRPAVQQTYRGTPPPARRPVESYTPRPVLPDDYDDALIQGQIPNQNQYQTAIRQQTRGDVNELGYDHVPSSVRTTIYEATSLSTTPPTTSTTFTTTTTTTTTSTTKRPTTAPFKETITVTRFSPRPSNTRGRGSAHYSTGSDSPQQTPNRGTPPTRSRPTLKPSTAIVSKTAEAPDIYTIPPSRPAPVYPQPLPDKTAAKCRKDVCLLPDCFCGGKDIPGDLPVESVPQIVVLTFDDSVNDLNKGLYSDLFEKGRVNPNGCPISATFYVSHEWTDYSQVQNLYSAGHEMASHTISHSFGEQFSQKKWNREVGGQREILAAYGGVKLEDVRGMRAPFLSVGGNKMFKMLYDSNFTYDSSLPVYENKPPSWPYTLDYKLFHDCMIPPCPTKSYPGVWEVPMVMWQDLNGGRCSMGDACANPSEAEGVYKMILKNFDRHYTSNRAPFGLFYHAAWFTQAHHKEGFIMFLDFINKMKDVWIVTNWQALQWVRDPTPISRLNSFQPFQCNYQGRPKKCNNPKVCNLWHKSGVRYMRTCQPCPEIYPWTGKTGIRSSRIDNEIEDK